MKWFGAQTSDPASSERRPARFLLLVQAVLTGCAILMCCWARMPWVGTAGLGLLGASAMAAELVPSKARRPVWKWSLATAWICTLALPATLWLTSDAQFTFARYLDQYYAVLAWLIAAAILPSTHSSFESGFRPRWKLPVMVWAGVGGLIWLGTAYEQNRVSAFYVGLLINIALLVLLKLWFALPGWGIQMVNTLILLLVALPVTDRLFHPAYHLQNNSKLRQRLYSYAEGHKDPVAYASWWDVYLKQVAVLEKSILMPDPARYLPYRLRPGSHGMLFQSRIDINHLGFRGKEIPPVKGNTYRIVALGESTTFGITLNPQDRPWPELLEELIQQRLNPRRPVEVINAGVPGYTLDDNLFRFAKDILPLHPDMVISYHGINGFPMLNPAIPSNVGPPPPRYQERPVRFLADCEYHLRLLQYRRRQGQRVRFPAPSTSDPLTSIYAQEYRRLIGLARTNHFRLVIGNFSMAVNAHSDPKIIRFYQVAYARTPQLIQANEAHSQLIRELTARNPDTCFVDTHPHLDGECEHFLDLVHFAPPGDRQLAENFFNGIKKILEADLGSAAPVDHIALKPVTPGTAAPVQSISAVGAAGNPSK